MKAVPPSFCKTQRGAQSSSANHKMGKMPTAREMRKCFQLKGGRSAVEAPETMCTRAGAASRSCSAVVKPVKTMNRCTSLSIASE